MTPRWFDVLAAWPLRLALWALLAAAVGPANYESPHHLIDFFDDHQFHAWETANRLTVLKYGELPAWNPYWCGGTPGVAAPEDSFYSPDFLLLRLPFGVALGRHLTIILLMMAGLEGMYRLARQFGSSAPGAALAALTYGTYDRFSEFITRGASNFHIGFELLPWAALGLLLGFERPRWRLAGGFVVGWIFLAAGTYPGPFAVLVLAVLTAGFAGRDWLHGAPKQWLQPIKSFVTVGVVAFLIAACKLVPLLAFMAQFKRVWLPVEANTAMDLLSAMLPHYGTVVGLALVGLVYADFLTGLAFAAAALFFLLAMGDFGPLSPYHLLKKVPFFTQLRAPGRYTVPTILFLSLGAGRTVTRMQELLAKGLAWMAERTPPWRNWGPLGANRAQAAAAAVALVATGAVLWIPAKLMAAGVTVTAPIYVEQAPLQVDQPFAQSRGNRRDGHMFAAMNRGTLYCITGIPVPESPLLRADLPQEEYALDPAAQVSETAWSPHAISLAIDATAATTVVVNQNFDKHWRSDRGEIINYQGLLAVKIAKGKQTLQLRYRDPLVVATAAMSGLTALFLLGVALWRGWAWMAGQARLWRSLPWRPRRE